MIEVYKDREKGIDTKWVAEEVSLEDCRGEIENLIKEVGLCVDDVDKAENWFAVREKGKIVGCMALERRNLLVYIQSLSVDKVSRKKGIARAMVELGFEEYVHKGEAMVALTLFWNIKTYEKLGFVRVEPKVIKEGDDVGAREKHRYCTAMLRLKE